LAQSLVFDVVVQPRLRSLRTSGLENVTRICERPAGGVRVFPFRVTPVIDASSMESAPTERDQQTGRVEKEIR
jgi:hypothetical protein